MGVVTFNGITSKSIGIEVEVPPDYDIPERIYETLHVPGRNGDIIMDTGSYKNSSRVYQVCLGSDGGNFATLANKISGWLHSAPGYLKLEDSYTPDYFMLARYGESNSITNIYQQAARASLTFDRQPQRFLKIGDIPVTVTTSKAFTNPTKFDSKPLIRVNGNGDGTITCGAYTISITNLSGYMYIDSNLEDAFKEAMNMNRYVTVPNGFPILKPGNTTISYTGGIMGIVVTPRWWTI